MRCPCPWWWGEWRGGGAGANLAFAGDIVIAKESASFIQSFCKLGLIPDTGGTFVLPRLVGRARAAGLALLGDKLSAKQAQDWGLIWQCVADTEFDATLERLAQHFAKAPTKGLAFTKRALQASLANDLATQLDLERDMMRELGRSADYAEGVAAFLDKREPQFKGNDEHARSQLDVPSDPQELAQAVGAVMYAGDAASQGLDMKVEEMAPGYARLTMRVRPDMLNGHKTCHGGFIFALADSAFAFSCNSRNVSTVASGCTIDFLAPGFEGDLLTAVAQERSLAGRTGVYDVTVTNQDGRNVAIFRGRSYRIKGQIVGVPADA